MEATHLCPIDQLILEANSELNFKLYIFEETLNKQMLLLKHGPGYFHKILDRIIEEISGEGVIGYE